NTSCLVSFRSNHSSPIAAFIVVTHQTRGIFRQRMQSIPERIRSFPERMRSFPDGCARSPTGYSPFRPDAGHPRRSRQVYIPVRFFLAVIRYRAIESPSFFFSPDNKLQSLPVETYGGVL